MSIAISIASASPDASPHSHFGRAPAFLLVDPATGERRAADNPALGASGGAGIQAAEFIVRQGVEAVISGSIGPKAYQVLAAAGIRMYEAEAGSVEDLLSRYQNGELTPIEKPSGGGGGHR